MMDHTPTSVPRTRRAVTALYHQATEPEAEPVVIDAAHVPTALLTAAVMIGGEDEHVWHWLGNSSTLATPRTVLAGQRVRRGRRSPVRGRLVAADLAVYDHARPAHRRAVREVITAALTRANGIVR